MLTVGEPFENVMCSWVAPAARSGAPVVLKIGMPHMEGEHEIAGLRFWNGDGMIRLLDADESLNAMLLERCIPGDSLAERPALEQDTIIATLLRRLWREPPSDAPFRPLSEMIVAWRAETLSYERQWSDPPLVREGLDLFERLANDAAPRVLLATDLHAGNVLRAEREAWLAIDPKPFVGDPAFDATQYLMDCRGRLAADARGTVQKLADLLGVDRGRVHAWLFARLAAEPRTDWTAQSDTLALARIVRAAATSSDRLT